MEKLVTAFLNSAQNFANDEEGAQIVEYALIIAVISIALIAAMGTGTNSIASSFTTFVGKVKTCLTTGACAW